MVRTSLVLSLALAFLAGCAGKQIPQHTGYKGKKPTPWTKATAIELDDELAGKAEGELDYGAYKRAKWFTVTLPGPGELTIDLEVVPSGDADMDVAMEVLDKNFHVVTRADADAEDANEQKKQRKLADLDEGIYYIHLYLEGRLDAADFEVKLKFARGTKPWKSDFPQQVAYLNELPAVPPLDDTPMAPPKPPPKPHGPRPPKPPKPDDPTPRGPQPVAADISDIQPDTNGSKLVIAAGTNDGVADGMKGSVPGIKLNTFTLFGCGPNRCFAKVKAQPDDVRAVGTVIIRP
jgi:hypothetical protein